MGERARVSVFTRFISIVCRQTATGWGDGRVGEPA